MKTDEDLDRLAEAAGIVPTYWDLRGAKHDTAKDTKRALLAALGFPAAAGDDIRGSLHALETADWQRMLPPAVVWRHQPGCCPVTLTAEHAGRRLRWRLDYESGDVSEGDFLPSGAPVLEGAVIDGVSYARYALPLPRAVPGGSHAVSVDCGGVRSEGILVVAPATAYRPAWLSDWDRVWGLWCHLYGLRSEADWGIGDLGGLRRLAGVVAAAGGDVVAINPLHALFPPEPEKASPYWPSSRLFLNPLYLDAAAAAREHAGPAAQALLSDADLRNRIARAAAADQVRYGDVSAMKHAVLRHVTDAVARRGDPRLDGFVAKGGEPLRRFAVYGAISDALGVASWRQWPRDLQNPADPAVARWEAAHRPRVRHHMILQWLMHRQLAATADAMAGMKVGLMRDLAAGVSPDGADAWDAQALYPGGVRFGAPPDEFSAGGQDWGMSPPNPFRLREQGYAPFRAVLRANMAHAGALRIDHVMGLQRLFWIPPGAAASDGAYVRYPTDDLLGILALESARHRCLMVGEDLGTVPEGFRERMDLEGILSTRLFCFERHESGLFKQPLLYPARCVAQAATHDLPTLAGYWLGHDIAARRALDPSFPADGALAERARVRKLVLAALRDQGLLGETAGGAPPLPQLIAAVYGFLARSPAQVVLVGLDDAMAAVSQLNMPGTAAEYPNWRMRAPSTLETLPATALWRELTDIIARERAVSAEGG